MTQAELNREVATRTGESVATIRRHGFNLLKLECPRPLVVNWDRLEASRLAMLPDRQCQHQMLLC